MPVLQPLKSMWRFHPLEKEKYYQNLVSKNIEIKYPHPTKKTTG